MNVDTSAVMRVVIENFNMTAKEMERLWAMQDNYINLLETQLRQSEEKVGKESMRVKMFRCKVIRMKQEIFELKASLARSPDELRQTLENVCLDHNYNKPVKETGPEKSQVG